MPVQGAPPKRKAGQNEPAPPPNPIVDRGNSLPHGFIQDHPVTALHMLFSSLPTDQFKQMATGLSAIYPWLKANNGPNGSFLTPRATALTITDPEIRKAALGTIDVLQRAAEANQTYTQQMQQGTEGLGFQAPGTQYTRTAAATSHFIFSSKVGANLTLEVNAETKTITIPTSDVHNAQYLAGVETMKQLYPDWTVKTVSSDEAANVIGGIVGGIGKSLDYTLGLPLKAAGAIPGPVGRQAKRAEGWLNTAVGRATDLSVGAVEQTGRLFTAPIENNFFGGHESLLLPKQYWWPDQPGNAIGNVVSDGLHISQDDPARQSVSQSADLAAQLILTAGVGSFFRGVKTGRTSVVTEAAEPGVHGRLAKIGFDLTKTPVDQWVQTSTGRAFGRIAWDIKQKWGNQAGATLQRYFGEDIVTKEIASALNHSASQEEFLQAFSDIASHVHPQIVAKMSERLAEITRRLKTPEFTDETVSPKIVERSKLRLEQKQLEGALRKLPIGKEPVRAIPTRTTILKVAASETKFGDFLRFLYNPPTRFAPHPARMFDMLGKTTIYNHFRSDAPADAMTQNIRTLRNYLGRAGVRADRIDGVIQGLYDARHSEDFFKQMKSVGDTIENHGSAIAADMRRSLAQMYRRDVEAEKRGQIEYKTEHGPAYEGILERPDGYQPPSMTAELIDHYNLPDVNTLVEATSLSRQLIRSIKRKGKDGAWVPRKTGELYDVLTAVNRAVTGGMKTAILAPRALGGALIFRIQGEQALRAHFAGVPTFTPEFASRIGLLNSHKGRVFTEATRDAVEAKITDYVQAHDWSHNPDMKPVVEHLADGRWRGSVHLIRRDVETIRRFRNEIGQDSGALGNFNIRADPHSNGDELTWGKRSTDDHGSLDDQAASMILDEWIKRTASPEMRKLIELQGNVTEWEKWLKTDPAGKSAWEQMQLILQDSKYPTVAEWGKRSYEAAKQYAGGDEQILDAMVTGHWRHIDPDEVTSLITSYEEAGRYQQLQQDLVSVRENLDSAFFAQDSALISSLAKERRRIIDQLTDIESRKDVSRAIQDIPLVERPGYVPMKIKSRSTPMGDRLGTIEAMKAAYGRTFNPPAEVRGIIRDLAATDRKSVAQRFKDFFGFGSGNALTGLTKADLRLTRGSTFTKVASDEYQRLRKIGYSDEQAFAHAKVYGQRMTRDIMYDLTERSSMQRALRNVFWFLPAWQELLTTWFIKLPAKSYWPIGLASMYGQAHAAIGLLKLSGAIHKNANGQDVINVPGLGEILDKITGSKVPTEVYGYPSGLNIATQGFPAFSTQWQALIEGAHKIDPNSEALTSIHNAIHQYSPAVTVGPAAINYFYEALTGKAPPWEIFSHRYQQQIVNIGMEKAMQQARASLGPPPEPKGTSPVEQKSYHTALDKYRSQLVSKARSTYRAWQLLTAFGATSSPMSLHVTDAYRQDWSAFYSKVLSPDYDAKNYSKAETDLRQFLEEHPGGFGYTVAQTRLTGEGPKNPGYTANSQQAYYQQLYDHVRKAYSSEQFATFMAGTESRRHLLGQLDDELAATGKTWQQQMLHRYDRKQAFDNYRYEWQKYLDWNPEFAAQWNGRDAINKQLGLKPTQDYAVEQQIKLIDLLSEAAPHLEANGVPASSLLDITTELGKVFDGKTAASTPTTASAKAQAKYMDETYIPYVKHLNKLFNEAAALSDRGINPGPVYDEIRHYEEKQNTIAREKGIPEPQAVTWGNKSPEDQRTSAIKWGTEPIGWLTSFQRTKAGYDKKFNLKAGVINGFFTYQTNFDDWLKRWKKANGVSGNSAYADTLTKWRSDWLKSQAQAHGGKQLVKLFSLNDGTPVDRLSALGYGKGVPAFNQLVAAADQINQTVQQAGYDPSGNSSTAIYYRSWFHSIVEKQLSTDPKLDDLLQELALTTPTKNGYMQGNPLYDALFFNARPITLYPESQPWSQEKLQGQGNGPMSVQTWMSTYHNGQIPFGAMSSIGGGFYLQPAAASAFEQAVTAAKKDGVNILASVTSAYRSYQEQASLYNSGNSYPVAAPGTSNHGWGLALDLSPGSTGWNWLRAYGMRWGWDNTGSTIGDPPHFTFRSAAGV